MFLNREELLQAKAIQRNEKQQPPSALEADYGVIWFINQGENQVNDLAQSQVVTSELLS